nr:Retrovirus-related Pol polyprotein from transposon TNT 1-94 [Ipomoea batatas]
MMNSGFLDFAVNIPKLEHFEGVGFRRWQKKMKFLLAALNVAYVPSTPKPVEQEDETLEATLMEQFHEIVRILGQIRHHGMNMDDSIAIASIIDKLPPSWYKVHRALIQRKEELTMEQLSSHLYVEEGIRQKESKKKSGGSLRRMEKGKERHGLNAGCATVHTLKRTVKFGRERCKAYLLVIMAKEVANGNKIDDSWWVDTGATRHVCKDMNLYKSYKNLEDGPSLYMGNDSMVKMAKEDEVPPCGPERGICSEHPKAIMEQFHEIVRILGQIRHHGMNMDDSIAIASIIDKLPPSWYKVHRALIQRKEELTMEQLSSHLYVEEGIRQKEYLRRMEKGKERHGLNAGCATVHTLKRTVKFGRERCKAYLLVIMAKEVPMKQGKIINLVSDSTENFIAMISEVYVIQIDDSWWVDTGLPGMSVKI